MTVLITGAYGFVGTNLSAYLVGQGVETWALDVRQAAGAETRSPYARRFDWDQLQVIPWEGVDAVVHLAGKAHDTRNTSDAKSYFDVNVGLTKKVLEAYRTAVLANGTNGGLEAAPQPTISARKFILFSSVKAVADRVEGVLTEDAVPDPKTPYGQSKLAAESYVRSAVGSGQSGLRSYILRPCMIHGPGNKGNLNLLYALVKRGVPWPLGKFENRRSFASIGNVCAVVYSLLTGDVSPGVYQVADDETISTNELIDLMAKAQGRPMRIWHVPAGLVRWLARVGDVLRLPLNSERLKKLTESYTVSNAKLKAAFGWSNMPVRAQEGLRVTLVSFGGMSRGGS
jgi:nucleoside-diphosphate-sugar epimerase